MNRSNTRLLSCGNIWIILVFFTILNYGDSFSGEFEPGGKPEIEVVNPGAEVVLGALLNVREQGVGLFGCGDRRSDGVITAKALKWATDKINKKIWSSTSPNVSIGLQIMDSCSRARIATSQLTEFLPELMGEGVSKQGNHSYKLGVIDDIGLSSEADVSNTLAELNIPVVKTGININSQDDIMNAVLHIIRELHWNHIALIHSNSRYSLSMLKTFTKSLKRFDLCVPWIINLENIDEKNYNDDLTKALKSGVPIISFLTSERHKLILRHLKDLPKQKHKISFLFTDLIERDDLKDVPIGDVQLLALIPLPEKNSNFEMHSLSISRTSNWSYNGLIQEDELELFRRTRTLRKMETILDKFSELLRELISEFCGNENSVCPRALSTEGRNMAFEELNEADWSRQEESYGLMEYHYKNPAHVFLHKIMVYNKFKSVDIFDQNLPFLTVNCNNDAKTKRPECNCLEAKAIRKGSARNIADKGEKEMLPSNKFLDNDPMSYTPVKKEIDQFLNIPTAFSSFRKPINAILACLILLGSFFTLFTGQYFATFAALPNGGLTSGTSIIGYFILIGLFFLYVTNLSFILTPSIVICTIRRFGTSSSYALIFSGMMIKVWIVWKQTKYEKVGSVKPPTLIISSLSFSTLQVLFSGLWLILVPPRIHYDTDQWMCYPSGNLDSHLLVSMIYIIGILLTTAVLAIKTSAKNNNDESRWILISSALVAMLFSCWGIAIATGVWQNQRTAVMNLLSATILLCCLYIPKVKAHSKLKKMEQSGHQNPLKLVEEFPVLTTLPTYPPVLDCSLPSSPSSEEDISDSTYSNEAYSLDDGTESMSVPFQIDGSSISDIDQEPVTFSSFFGQTQTDIHLSSDPTQIVPSNLYSLDMFSNESHMEERDHCEPGTNEFTPQHRVSSQLYLYPAPEWVP